jgi:hypothetical protein
MIKISHRGNLTGPNKERENTKEYISEAIVKGFYVEVDIWKIGDRFYLGHDEPTEEVDFQYLVDNNQNLVLHCKNVQALQELKTCFVCFFHDSDDCVLMSNCSWIWTYPGRELTKDSIAVLPERIDYWRGITACLGVCSDYVSLY